MCKKARLSPLLPDLGGCLLPFGFPLVHHLLQRKHVLQDKGSREAYAQCLTPHSMALHSIPHSTTHTHHTPHSTQHAAWYYTALHTVQRLSCGAFMLTLTRCRGAAAMLITPSDCWRCRAIMGSSSGRSWSGCSARCRTVWKTRCSSGLNMSLGRKASHVPPTSPLHRGVHTTPHITSRHTETRTV